MPSERNCRAPEKDWTFKNENQQSGKLFAAQPRRRHGYLKSIIQVASEIIDRPLVLEARLDHSGLLGNAGKPWLTISLRQSEFAQTGPRRSTDDGDIGQYQR